MHVTRILTNSPPAGPPSAQAGLTVLTPRLSVDDFTAIYDLYHDPIVRHCRWKLHNNDAGQDLAQATFLRFWHCLQQNIEIRHVRAYLYRIAHNLIIDHVRKKKEVSLDELLEIGFEPCIDPWHVTYNRLDAQRPLGKLATMRKPYRQALHLRYMQGLTPAQIAHITGESSNVVSVRIFRGLKQLKEMLVEQPVSPVFLSPPTR